MRTGQTSPEELKVDVDVAPSKLLEKYEKVFANNTEFFSTYNPDMIEEALLHHLKHEENVEAQVNPNKYKVKFVLSTKDGELTQEVQICIRILKVDDTKVCVEFSKVSGGNERYHEHYLDLMRTLAFCNDTL